MKTTHCPYCHQHIDSAAYPSHEAAHRKLLSDGQQSAYATLPAEERAAGPVDLVPQVYRHDKCHQATVMPEDIIRTYLKDPYFYRADRTYCCGCRAHVPMRECVWVETGQNLQTYMDVLRAEKPELRPADPPAKTAWSWNFPPSTTPVRKDGFWSSRFKS